MKGKLSYIRLFVPFLLFAGVQVFAQAAADNGMPEAGPASHQMMRPHADVVLISDRTFLMKSIEGIAMKTGCASSLSSSGTAKSFISGGCPIVDCAAPPPGCYYQGPADTGPNGCPINCGHLVCGSEF
jgi:hypothetical protein